MRILSLCFICLMLSAFQAQAEIRVSGYGSIAAGKVLSGLIKRIDKNVAAASVGDVASLQAALAAE